MKTLYIVRHAKSSWKNPELRDEERPLLEKGKKRTKKVIDVLLDKNISVDCIISSHAVRAVETARILAHALQYPKDRIMIDKSIYHYDADKLFNVFYDLPADCNSVMLVGHNPTLTNFVNNFLSPGVEWLPTSAVVAIEFDTDRWEKIPLAEKRTRFILEPGKLKKKK